MKKALSIILILSMLLALLPSTIFAAQAKGDIAQSPLFPIEPSYYSYVERPNATAQGDVSSAVQAMNACVSNVAEWVSIAAYNIPVSDITGILNDIVYQNPAFFYLNYYAYSKVSGTEIVSKVYFYYHYEAPVVQQMKATYETAAAKALAGIQPDMTNAEKALTIHDFLVLNAKYDYENYLAGNIPHLSNKAYGVLVNGTGVCNSYALAYQDLLTRLGITVIKVTSSAMNHAWNMVYLDGSWYHVDVTWDDSVYLASNGWLNNDYDLEGRVSHKNFLLSSPAISSDHSGWLPNTNIANNTQYDGDYANIKSGMFWNQGYWYYNNGGNLTRSLFGLSGSSVLKTMNGVDNNYSYLGVFNNEIYYNITASDTSKSEIRKCKFDGSGDTQVLLINNTGQTIKEKITELVIQGNVIKYTVYRNPASGSEQYAVRYLTLTTPASLTARETAAAVINPASHFISGLKTGLTQTEFENTFVAVTGDAHLAYTPASGLLGTGAQVELIDSVTSEVLATYTIVIFGDVNGDGKIDSLDAGLLVDYENYIIAWHAADDAATLDAADINGDGKIDSLDAGLVVDAENYLVTIDQSAGLAG